MGIFYGNSERGDKLTPAEEQMILTRGEQEIIGKDDIKKATEILTRYKQGKANLEKRIVEDEEWYKMRHWEAIRGNQPDSPAPASAWLFNAIINKHADAMDNYPEHVVLPREKSDEASAKALSNVLPVVLEYNDYQNVYSEAWYDKLKHGTAVYGCFWDTEKENGLGDISVRGIDLLKIFWEPGITDIQKSRNLFIVELCDNDLLLEAYPDLKKAPGNTVDITKYKYDDTIDTSDKSVVVDWYYKVRTPDGRTALHYVKFAGDTVLYASQNDPVYRDMGWYEHGMYPVVFDTLFPEKDTPCGFGYVSICRDPQMYIDKLSANILESSIMGTKKRYFASSNTNINIDEFLDWNQPIVHVEGEIDERRIKEISVAPLDAIYVNIMQMKIDEMKDTAANRDVNSGGAAGGITAASAIAALQEAGNKVSRDMISASYRVHTEIGKLCIELMRQFYDVSRTFRITGDAGTYSFVDFDNSALKDQSVGVDSLGVDMYRHPVFDLKISAQKKSPFARASQNELAKELYSMGFFNPERADEAIGALELMDFEGIENVKEKVKEGQTLASVIQQMQAQMEQMTKVIQGLAGDRLGISAGEDAPKAEEKQEKAEEQLPVNAVNGKIADAQVPATAYAESLAKRSTPHMP